jgi:hypothetical protein
VDVRSSPATPPIGRRNDVLDGQEASLKPSIEASRVTKRSRFNARALNHEPELWTGSVGSML